MSKLSKMDISVYYVRRPSIPLVPGLDYSKLPKIWEVAVYTGVSYHIYTFPVKPTDRQIRSCIKKAKASPLFYQGKRRAAHLLKLKGQFSND